VATVLCVTLCSKFVRDGTVHHFEWNRAGLGGLHAEYKEKDKTLNRYRGADKSFNPTRKETSYSDRRY
jgi:hypothetical protein